MITTGLMVPCVVSSSVMWITDKRRQVFRQMLGCELLALQGLDYAKQPLCDPPMTQAELTDLAGNAFCGFTVAPLIIGVLSSFDLAKGLKRLSGDGSVDDDAPGDDRDGGSGDGDEAAVDEEEDSELLSAIDIGEISSPSNIAARATPNGHRALLLRRVSIWHLHHDNDHPLISPASPEAPSL